MLTELAQVLVEPALILGLQLHARGADAVGRNEMLHALLADGLRVGAGVLLELRVLRGMGTVTAAGEGERERAMSIGEAEMQRGEGTHGEADDMGAREAERIQHAADVVAGAGLRVALPVLRHIRGRIAARVVGDAAVAAREMPHLRLPAALISC